MKSGTNISIAFIIVLISVVLASGCVNQKPEAQKTLMNVTKDGIDYSFTNNIYDSLKIPINNETEIRRLIMHAPSISLVFNPSSEQDNSYFTVVLYNTVDKLKYYYTYTNGKYVDESMYNIYMINGTEFLKLERKNSTWIKSPSDINNIEWPVLYLKGPNTGASETSVKLSESGKIIYIQGTDYKNLSLASERFVLAVLDVTEETLSG